MSGSSTYDERRPGSRRRVPGCRRFASPAAAACALAAAVLAAGGSLAQDASRPPKSGVSLSDMSLEELAQLQVQTVRGASRHDQKTTDAPSSVTIITREDIQEYGYRTLADALRSVRGFYVTYDREYAFIGVRGFNRPGDYGGRVLVTIDGHRMNDSLYDSNLAGTEFPLDMDLVERIEVIRGAGSVLYGDNAFFGIVNVVTRRGRDVGGLEVSAIASSYDAYAGRVTYGRAANRGLEVLFSLSGSDSAGARRLYFPEFQSIHGGVAEDLDGDAHGGFYGELRSGDWRLSGGYGKRTKHVPTAPFGSLFNDPSGIDIDAKGYADLRYDHTFANGAEVQARAYFDQYTYDGQLAYPFGYAESAPPGKVTLDKETDTALSAGIEAQVRRRLWRGHSVTVGGELRWDPQLDLRVYDVDPPAVWKDQRTSARISGVYLQDEIRLGPALDLNAGFRVDTYDRFGSTFNPRVALLYRPGAATTLKLLYGEAFRAPNIAEYGYPMPGYRANPNLRPETIRSYEIALEQEAGPHLRWSGSLFWSDVGNLIDQAQDAATGDYYSSNLGGARTRGIEAEVEGRWAHGLRARLSYTYADAVDTTTEAWLTNSPRHLVQLNLAAEVCPKTTLGLDLQAMSRRRTAGGGVARAYAVANLTLRALGLAPGWEISAGAYNVFGARYADPVPLDYRQDTIPQDGPTFRLKVMRRF